MLIYKIKNKKTNDYLKDSSNRFDYSSTSLADAINRHRKMKFETEDNYDDFKVVEESAPDWCFVSFG